MSLFICLCLQPFCTSAHTKAGLRLAGNASKGLISGLVVQRSADFTETNNKRAGACKQCNTTLSGA